MDRNDQAIVEECISKMRSGNDFSDDYAALVRRHSRLIFAVALSWVKDYHKAEEIVQIAFLKAYRNLDKFRERGNFTAWLCAIARNCCIDSLRGKNSRLLSIEEITLNHSAIPENLYENKSPAETNEMRRQINRAILFLPELLREAAVMRFLEGASYKQIARRLGVPETTVRTRLFRARKILHKSLQPLMNQLKGGA